MKLSVAIADTGAMPNAFVVFRGFEESIRKAARLGYDGVELALKHPDEVDEGSLSKWLDSSGLEVSCISTGQVYAGLGLSFTESDRQKREVVEGIFHGFIDLAARFGRMVNIGRVRGAVGSAGRGEAERRFIEMVRKVCSYAAAQGVTLILEPVNRYELDFVNSVQEGVDLLERVGMDNLKLMPDLFHMNIEDVTIAGELARHAGHVAYVHFADSNRLAPGQGHLDFESILAALDGAGYGGWIGVEILPYPDPDTAARSAVEFLKPLLPVDSD